MRTRLTLRPNQHGAKRLRAQYGERLGCVRYRYDAQRKKRCKTVGQIVEESDWQPPSPPPEDDRVVRIHVAFPEKAVRQRVKEAGGRWDPEGQVWELAYR